MSKRQSFESKVVTWAQDAPIDTVRAIVGIEIEILKKRIMEVKLIEAPAPKPKRQYTKKAKAVIRPTFSAVDDATGTAGKP